VIEIRSYRRVFDLERRIYRIDHLRLNPGGIPVRGVVYLLAVIALVAVVGRLPLVRYAIDALPWYLSYVALPLAVTSALSVISVEGRPFHLAAFAMVRSALSGPRRRGLRVRRAVNRRWSPTPIVCLPDGSDARLRSLRYTGPGALAVAAPHSRRQVLTRRASRPRLRRRALLLLEPLAAQGQLRREVIVLQRGACVEVRVDGRRRERD
jgi:hypothetical protein